MKPAAPAAHRRFFFRDLARQTVVFAEELRGTPHVTFDELFKLQPEKIGARIPRICPGVRIVPEEGQVLGRLPDAKEAVAPLRTAGENLAVFNRFNGQNTAGQVVREASAAMVWSEERSFDRVKGLFFRLVRLRVCVPANPVLP